MANRFPLRSLLSRFGLLFICLSLNAQSKNIQTRFQEAWFQTNPQEVAEFYQSLTDTDELSKVLDLHIRNFPSNSSVDNGDFDHLAGILIQNGASLLSSPNTYSQFLNLESRLSNDTLLMRALFDKGLPVDFSTNPTHYTQYPGNLIDDGEAASILFGIRAGGEYRKAYSMDLTAYCFQSLFHWACHYGRLEVIDYLLEYDPSVQNIAAWSPQGILTEEKYYENGLTTALQPTKQRPYGSTPLAPSTLMAMLRTLKATDVDILIPNYRHQTCLSLAEETKQEELIDAISKWTAKQRVAKQKDELELMKMLYGIPGPFLDSMKIVRKPFGEISPLTYAVIYKLDKLTTQLLAQGASPLARAYRTPYSFMSSPYRAAFLHENEDQLLELCQAVKKPSDREKLLNQHIKWIAPDYRLSERASDGNYAYPFFSKVYDYLSQGMDSIRVQALIEQNYYLSLNDQHFNYWLEKAPKKNQLALKMRRFYKNTQIPKRLSPIAARMVLDGLPLDAARDSRKLSVYRTVLRHGSPELLEKVLKQNPSILTQSVYIKETDSLSVLNPLIEVLPKGPGFAFSTWEEMAQAPNFSDLTPEEVKAKIQLLQSYGFKNDSPDFRNVTFKAFLDQTNRVATPWPKWLYDMVE